MRVFTNLFAIFISVVATTSSQPCTKCAHKMEHMNKELTIKAMSIYSNYQTNQICAFLCMETHGCLSMSYHRKEQTCLLHNVSSSSVSTEDFLAVPGSVYSDLETWPMSGPCRRNTCADDEHCQLNGNQHICITASAPVCLKNPMALNCFKRYANADLHGMNIAELRRRVTVEECIRFCSANPNFRSFQHNAVNNNCFCKSMVIREYLKEGNTLTAITVGVLYDRLW